MEPVSSLEPSVDFYLTTLFIVTAMRTSNQTEFPAVFTVISALLTEIKLSLIDFKVISNRKKVLASNYVTSIMKKY
jgi:hypothetical protein